MSRPNPADRPSPEMIKIFLCCDPKLVKKGFSREEAWEREAYSSKLVPFHHIFNLF
jgi:hypothetical protein